MSDELKVCPFCGGTDLMLDEEAIPVGRTYYNTYFIECLGEPCPMIIRNRNRKKLIDLWNTRPLEDDLRSKLDEVIVFLKWMMAQDEIFDVDKYIIDILKRLEE